MRVLFVDQFSDFGGAQLGLRDLMEEGAQRGWELWFAAPGKGGLFDYCKAAGISTRSLQVGAYRSGSKTLPDMARYIFDMSRSARSVSHIVRQNQMDLVYVNGPRILAATAGIRCPLVFHLHSVLDKTYSRSIVRWLLNRSCGKVIAASHFVAKALTTGLSRGSVRVIYNGVCDFGFVQRPLRRAKTTVGIIGRIAPEKGHLDLVRAVGLLADRGHDVRLTILGASLFSDPAYGTRVREAAGANVEFRGWRDDVATTLQEIDILAVPSSGVECSPRILLEAFSAGTPIVAYPSGGIPELLRNGQTGLLTTRAGSKELADTLERLLTNRDLMTRFSRNGRRDWESRFRVERFRSDVADVIEGCCSVQRRQPEAAATVACENYLSPVRVPRR